VDTATDPGELERAYLEVTRIQRKLQRWSRDGNPIRDIWGFVTNPHVLLVAWDRVSHNQGKNTPGIDQITCRFVGQQGVSAFLAETRHQLRTGEFRPQPVRRVYIPKPGKPEPRPLGIPTIRDRVVQAALLILLEPIYDGHFDSCSFGFRPKLGCQEAISYTRQMLSYDYQWVIEGDIKGCFDNIPHGLLLDAVATRLHDRNALRLIKAFLKAGIMEDLRVATLDSGVPQGGIISPLLTNIFLDQFDRKVRQRYPMISNGRWGRFACQGGFKVALVRYADDFILMVHFRDGTNRSGKRWSPEEIQEALAEIHRYSRDTLAAMGLTLHPSKTRITASQHGFDFLGVRFQAKEGRWHNGRRTVFSGPTRESRARFKHAIQLLARRTISKPRAMLFAMNGIIRGWGNYYRHTNGWNRGQINRFIWWTVLRGLQRHHDTRSARKVGRRYLAKVGERGGRWWRVDGLTVERIPKYRMFVRQRRVLAWHDAS